MPLDEDDIALAKMLTLKGNLYIQGAAGTGKSTLIHNYLNRLSNKEKQSVLVVAPTGIAADLIKGVTIHKAFELPDSVQLIDSTIDHIPKMLQNIKTIIIDEISMVRIDVFTKLMQTVQYIKMETSVQ